MDPALVLLEPVYNATNQKIGVVDDLVVAPDQSVSYAIIGVGGFLGMREHFVAIPVAQLKADTGKIVLPGATKDSLNAMPEFVYANK